MKKFMLFFLLFPLEYLQGQFSPQLYVDVESDRNYEFTLLQDEPFGIQITGDFIWTFNGSLHTIKLFLNDQIIHTINSKYLDPEGAENLSGWVSKTIKGPFKAGTKILVKSWINAPGDPSSRVWSLAAKAMSYNPGNAHNKLEEKFSKLEKSLEKFGESADKISSRLDGIDDKIFLTDNDLRRNINALDQQLGLFKEDNTQFKSDVNSRFNDFSKQVSAVENNFRHDVSALDRQFEIFKNDANHFNSDINPRFDNFDKQISSIKNDFKRDMNTFNQQLNVFRSDDTQFKSDINSRFNDFDKQTSLIENSISSLTDNVALNKEHHQNQRNLDITNIEKRFIPLEAEYAISKNNTASLSNKISSLEQYYKNFKDFELKNLKNQLSVLEAKHLRPFQHNNTLGIIGTSLGGAAAALAVGTILYDGIQDKNWSQRKISNGKEFRSVHFLTKKPPYNLPQIKESPNKLEKSHWE